MKKLTLKQRKFVKAYVESGNAANAAKKSGYSKNCARQIGAENLTKPVIKQTIQVLMETRGLSDDRLLEVLESGLAADKIVDNITAPDYPTRHKYLETALKLKNYFSPPQIEDNANISQEEMQQRIRVIKKYLLEDYSIMPEAEEEQI